VAVHDALVAAAFVRVMHLLDAPERLFAPAVLWRVLRRDRSAPRVQPLPMDRRAMR